MRIFVFFITVTILLCTGCNNETVSTEQKTEPIAKLDSLSKEKIKIELLELSPEAEKSLEDFEDFQNLRVFIKSLNTANPFFVNQHTDSLDLLIMTFEENLSTDLKKNTISSRINLLHTESGLLKLLAEKKHPDSKKIMAANSKLAIAYNSLIIQLNELSLAIPESIEKELLRELETEEE
ncbi:hypothetical protein [Aquimarina pacifica]|uniref:hypothetical protein n=1 Tax=Aquimarina pacifica TaxID=1296415 RepID=UPI00047014A6|nr:hypothetical protein [Aquimarina pacifica]